MRSAAVVSATLEASARDAAMVGSAQLHDDEMLFSSEIAASRRPFLVVSQFDWHTNFYSPLLLDTNQVLTMNLKKLRW